MLSKQTINKVLRLAKYGTTDGERDAARTILVSQGIDPDKELEDDFVWSKISVKTASERNIVFQLVFRLTNSMKITCTKKPRSLQIKIPAHLEKQLIRDAKTILPLWRKEIKKFESAFILKNDLFGQTNEPPKKSGLSDEEIFEIIEMAQSIQKANLVHLFSK
jgi:hypothetical protein